MQKDRLEEIYSTYADDVYHFLLHLCKDEHLAEDLLQDTFLRAIENIDSFDERCKLSSWLCQIAKNLYFDHWRKSKQSVNTELSEEIPDTSETSLEQLVLKETGSELLQLVHQLKDPYKEVFMLRVYGEMSLKEIAALFGKSEVWGRVTFLRAKESVIELYRKQYG